MLWIKKYMVNMKGWKNDIYFHLSIYLQCTMMLLCINHMMVGWNLINLFAWVNL